MFLRSPDGQKLCARIAQLVEQRIENPCVGGSNPPPGTILKRHGQRCYGLSFFAFSNEYTVQTGVILCKPANSRPSLKVTII